VVSTCRRLGVRFSVTAHQHKGLCALIEAIPEEAWVPIPYCDDAPGVVAAGV
jgi:hypothetical protein